MQKSSLTLPDDRYLAALERQRGRIENGNPLTFFDDTTSGNKDTSCSWGLCDNAVEAWPDPQDHLWPDQFTDRRRVAPLYRDNGQTCPLDTRPRPNTGLSGCFYTCRIFQARRGQRPDREETLRLYDVELERVRKDPR
jgi:hypothetical protein